MSAKSTQRGDDRKRITHAEWLAEGDALFGPDQMLWRFVCPSCAHVQTPADYKAAGARTNNVAFSCVGRWIDGVDGSKSFKGAGGPCDYAGGGLFAINPVTVVLPDGTEQNIFAFALDGDAK